MRTISMRVQDRRSRDRRKGREFRWWWRDQVRAFTYRGGTLEGFDKRLSDRREDGGQARMIGKTIARIEEAPTDPTRGYERHDTIVLHFTDGTAAEVSGSSYEEVSLAWNWSADPAAYARAAQGRREKERCERLYREWWNSLSRDERDRRDYERRAKLPPMARIMEDTMRGMVKDMLADNNRAVFGQAFTIPVGQKPGEGAEIMRAVGYVRCSTSDQVDGYGLPAQQQRIQQAVEHKGWELHSILSDEGVSGKTLERPRLMDALELIATRQADALVVAKLDRLTRSVVDFANLLEWFDRADAALVALDFDLDTSTPGGRLVGHIMSAVAEWERRTIAQRTKDGLAERRRQGKVIGRMSVVDHPEIVRLIQQLHTEECLSLQQIADRLNDLNVPTVRGGLMWRKSAVQSIVGYQRKSGRRSMVLPEVRSQRAR